MRNKNKTIYLQYTGLFLVFFIFVIGIWFFRYKKTMMWTADGMQQQFTSFIYVGRWLRNLLFHGQFQMWDMNLGFGADPLISLGSNFYDPFNWISIFIPEKYSEFGFNLSVLLRLYFSGFAFIVFCKYKKLDDFPSLVGSMIYAFSAPMVIAYRQPDFLKFFILFPLIIMSVDELWDKKFSLKYIILLMISMMNSFYFTFMICILLVLYFLIRAIYEIKEGKPSKDYCSKLVKFLLNSLLGIVIGLGFDLHYMMNLLQMDRLNVERVIPLFLDGQSLKNFIGNLLFVYSTGSDAFIGYTPIVFFCIVVMLFHYKNQKLLVYLFIPFTIALFLPIFGSLMNAGQYPTWRYIFAYHLLVSYIVAFNLNTQEDIKMNDVIKYSLVLLLLGVIIFVCKNNKQIELIILLLLLVILPFIIIFTKTNKMIQNSVVLFTTLMALSISSMYHLSYRGNFAIEKEVDYGTAYPSLMESGGKELLKEQNDIHTVRYSEIQSARARNSSFIAGVSGMDFYFSYYNQDIDKFMTCLEIPYPMNFSYGGIDGRSVLSHLLGIKYYLIPKDFNQSLPYGYSQLISSEENTVLQSQIDVAKKYPDQAKDIPYKTNEIELYQSDYVESLGTFFQESISEEEFMELSSTEKESALANYAILENGNTSYKSFIKPIAFTIQSEDSIDISESSYVVKKDNQYIDLLFDDINTSEIYLNLQNLYSKENYKQYNIKVDVYRDDTKVNSHTTLLEAFSPTYHVYGGKHSWTLNLGTFDHPVNKIRILFESKGEYQLDDIQIYANDKTTVLTSIESIQHPHSDFNISNNKVSVYTSLNDNGIYMLSIPYSKGWKLKVNNEQVDIKKTDIAFIGMDIKKGVNQIELTYFTPYLIPGYCIVLIGIIILIVLSNYYKKHGNE